MAKPITIQDALDYCLVNPDNLTVREMLARFPEYREELQALLIRAMSVEAAAPAVPAERRAAMKSRLMAAAEQKAAQQGYVPTARQAPPRYVERSAPLWRRPGILSLPWRRLASASMAAAAMLVFLVLWSASTALADSPLYDVKLGYENVRVALTNGPANKVRVHVELANIRLGDINAMQDANKLPLATKAVESYNYHITSSAEALKQTGGEPPEERTELANILSASSEAGSRTLARLSTENTLPLPVQASIKQTLKDTQQAHNTAQAVMEDPRKQFPTPQASALGGGTSGTGTVAPATQQPVIARGTQSPVVAGGANTPGQVAVSTNTPGQVSVAPGTITSAAPTATPVAESRKTTTTAPVGTQTSDVGPPASPVPPTQSGGGATQKPSPTESRTVANTSTATAGGSTATAPPSTVPPVASTPTRPIVATATRSAAIVQPTWTRAPIADTPVPTPTRPHVAPPVDTPVPPTTTRIPAPSNTPVRPIDTPVPVLPTATHTLVPPTQTPLPVPTTTVCDLSVAEVTVACGSGNCANWTARVVNSGPSTVSVHWTAELQVSQRGGGYETVNTQPGSTVFAPGSKVVSGNFCTNFPDNANGIKIVFTLENAGYNCNPHGASDGVSPCRPPSPTPQPGATDTPRPTNTQRPDNTPHPTHTPRPDNTPRPTDTVRPTNTPRPTNIPRPTNTPRTEATEPPEPTSTTEPTEEPRPSHTPQPSHTPRPTRPPREP